MSNHQKIVVSTPTQEAFDTLMEAYKAKGWRWRSGDSATSLETSWSTHKRQTCVRFHDSFIFAGREYFKDMGFKIITLKQALKKLGVPMKTKTLETLEVGDYIKQEDWGGNRRILSAHGEGKWRTYIISDGDEEKPAASYPLTAYELESEGYTITNIETTHCDVSLDEIAVWKGVPVDKIRVKKQK